MKILISRPDRIGDVVLSTAIPRELKKKYPDCKITLLLKNYTKDIYQNNPYVDNIILYESDDKFSFKKFWKYLHIIKKEKFDIALMLLPNEQVNYLLFFAAIKIRIGSGHKLFQMLTFTKAVSRNKYIPLRHEADFCMDLARKIGVETDNYVPEIYLSEEEKKIVEVKRKELLGDKKYLIGIHSTSGNSAPNWKVERYKSLIEKLANNSEIQLFSTDSPTPEKLLNLNNIKYNSQNTLRELILNIACLDVILSASTGPMHLASALKIKTVSLFCPLTACNPKLWGPLGNTHEIVMPTENYCSTQCPGDPKKCDFSRDGGIEIKDAESKIISLLK